MNRPSRAPSPSSPTRNWQTAAHEALIRSTHATQLVGHISRDSSSSAIHIRERFIAPTKPKPKAKTKRPKSGKKRRKPATFLKETQAQRNARGTRIEKRLKAATVEEMLKGIPTACDLGGKQGNNGQTKWWRGYKLHLDVADGNIPIGALITAAACMIHR